jgi:hypothetical protein
MRSGGRLTVGVRREALLVDIVVKSREVIEDGLRFGGMGTVEGSGSVETVRANSIQFNSGFRTRAENCRFQNVGEMESGGEMRICVSWIVCPESCDCRAGGIDLTEAT